MGNILRRERRHVPLETEMLPPDYDTVEPTEKQSFAFSTRLDDVESELCIARDNLRAIEAEVSALQDKLKAAQDEAQRYHNELKVVQKELSECKQTLKACRTREARLEIELDDREGTLRIAKSLLSQSKDIMIRCGIGTTVWYVSKSGRLGYYDFT